MEITVIGKKITLEKLRWNDYTKIEEKFGTLETLEGKSMLQARFALWLSVQRAGFKEITEEQIGDEVDPMLLPEITKAIMPEKREKVPLA